MLEKTQKDDSMSWVWIQIKCKNDVQVVQERQKKVVKLNKVFFYE